MSRRSRRLRRKKKKRREAERAAVNRLKMLLAPKEMYYRCSFCGLNHLKVKPSYMEDNL